MKFLIVQPDIGLSITYPLEAYVVMFIIQPIKKKTRSCRIGYPTSTRGDTAANNVLGTLGILGIRMNNQKTSYDKVHCDMNPQATATLDITTNTYT